MYVYMRGDGDMILYRDTGKVYASARALLNDPYIQR